MMASTMEPLPAASRLPERASKKTVGWVAAPAATASRRFCRVAHRAWAASGLPVRTPMRRMAAKSRGKSLTAKTATGMPRAASWPAASRASPRPSIWSTRSGLTASTAFQIRAHVGADDGQAGDGRRFRVGLGAGHQAFRQAHAGEDFIERAVQGHDAQGRPGQTDVPVQVIG